MALTKISGSVIKDSVSLSGNVSVGGTLTYQDVTNVDALGIGTFRTGIKVLAGQVDVGSNIKLGNAGVVTATSFIGSGANLTSLPSQLTLSNNADNRVITGGSGTNLNAESGLTFDGSTLAVSGAGFFTGNLTVLGTVTYEDVKNVDSIGIATARQGLNVTGGGIMVTSGIVTTTGIHANTGIVTATKFDSTSGIIENANTISSDYSIKTNNNAMSAGPISIANGVSVTVPSGSSWTIV